MKSKIQTVPWKYTIMDLSYKKVSTRDFITDFYLDKAPENRLDKRLPTAVKAFTKNSILREILVDYEVDVEVLNFSSLTIKKLEEAEQLLIDIGE